MSKSPWQLESLLEPSFRARFELLGTIDAVYAALRRSPEVRTLHCAMRERSVGHDHLDRFIRGLLQDFETGTYFEHQYALAGIAVACHQIPEEFAAAFISYLAGLSSIELQIAIGVARLVENDGRLAISTLSATYYGEGLPNDFQMLGKPTSSDTPQISEEIRLEFA